GGNGFDAYDSPDRGYVTDTISGDYKAPGGPLNPTSGLFLHTEDGTTASCIQSGGSTSYSEALRQARTELALHGRQDVPDYIVFLTHGEANIGSVYGAGDPTYPPGNLDDQQPCHSAINVANDYKTEGVTIYSIGYPLGDTVPCSVGGSRAGRQRALRGGRFPRQGHRQRAGLHAARGRMLPLREHEAAREPGNHLV